MTSILRTVVVASLLAAWSFPAAAATSEGSAGQSRPSVTQVASSSETGAASRSGAASEQAQSYADREQQKPDLQNFQGGEGYVYIGGGVLTAALLILLILILI
jgi:hypothetical protein